VVVKPVALAVQPIVLSELTVHVGVANALLADKHNVTKKTRRSRRIDASFFSN